MNRVAKVAPKKLSALGALGRIGRADARSEVVWKIAAGRFMWRPDSRKQL
jgi:hypothetical protein